MNQDTITIVKATIFGGIIGAVGSIVGGFLATLVAQSSNRRADERRDFNAAKTRFINKLDPLYSKICTLAAHQKNDIKKLSNFVLLTHIAYEMEDIRGAAHIFQTSIPSRCRFKHRERFESIRKSFWPDAHINYQAPEGEMPVWTDFLLQQEIESRNNLKVFFDQLIEFNINNHTPPESLILKRIEKWLKAGYFYKLES